MPHSPWWFQNRKTYQWFRWRRIENGISTRVENQALREKAGDALPNTRGPVDSLATEDTHAAGGWDDAVVAPSMGKGNKSDHSMTLCTQSSGGATCPEVRRVEVGEERHEGVHRERPVLFAHRLKNRIRQLARLKGEQAASLKTDNSWVQRTLPIQQPHWRALRERASLWAEREAKIQIPEAKRIEQPSLCDERGQSCLPRRADERSRLDAEDGRAWVVDGVVERRKDRYHKSRHSNVRPELMRAAGKPASDWDTRRGDFVAELRPWICPKKKTRSSR